MGRLWFLRRPLILFGSLAMVVALLVGIGVWRAHRDNHRLTRCYMAAQTAERHAAAPLVVAIAQADVPGALRGMPVGQTGWGAPVIGPWTTRLTSEVVARRIAAWLPRAYLSPISVTTTRFPAGREWIVRGDDLLGHGVFLEVTAKPLESKQDTDVVGYIGVPAAPSC
jgi:hypothetical protein